MLLQLTVGNLIIICVSLVGVLGALLKLIVSQHEKGLDANFVKLTSAITENLTLISKLEHELIMFQTDCQKLYLRRDDYLQQLQATSDATQRQFAPILKSLQRIEDYLLRQKD